ncbi:FmdE family protein [Candidatus Allofournierella excrementigallinarum]|uniref:FmdE family protein n=1 Tax=Candidatus Allofournierella excrementigallinarum TaxID=2838592 RepID=UPI00374ECE91
MDENKQLWQKAADFHGHVCGGLTIGYKAALYAIELLGVEMVDGVCSKDEEIVCITENDACGVDAIQAILGCTVGKGNLLFHMRGKQAFSFYDRKNGRSVRLVLRPAPAGMTREQAFAYYQAREPRELFDVKAAALAVPERAKLFDSYVCENCGEVTGANWVRVANGKHLCLDCCPSYDRFNV